MNSAALLINFEHTRKKLREEIFVGSQHVVGQHWPVDSAGQVLSILDKEPLVSDLSLSQTYTQCNKIMSNLCMCIANIIGFQ